ncbi:MAG: phospholipase D-like domain-containing protein [Fusobacterium sp.]|nr:phospholipase D-like domain-containing protein [Fusobacterium sp.]
MKQNFFAEFIFIVVLILFSVYRYFYNVESVVMKVFSPTMAAVDLNGNRQIESGEIVCVSGIKTFNNNLADDELAKTLGISYKDSLSLAYLTEDYATSLLSNKAVTFKPDTAQNNPDCTSGDIFINNKSYREKLLEEGYAYSDEFEYNSAKFKERIESAKELHPVIMNRKSKKYHEIGCKFGKASQDYAVLLKSDLPENAVPCKWCHQSNENPQTPQVAKVYPDRISDGQVRMFLTDMTTHLNVKNDCSSNICQALLTEINNAKERIDVAAYGWVSVPEVDEAIKNAVARGVSFRMVYDFSAREAYYPDTLKIARFAVESKNDLVAGNSRMSEFLMHNKFMIFDGKKVAAGSLNYSKTDFSEFNSNFILFVDSPEVAKVYTEEFEQMLSGKFHTDKTKRAQYSNYKIGDTDLQVYFSPQDNTITDKVLGYIEGAKKYIYMPVFVITHKPLEAALLRAKERGVDVRLIVDATNVSAKKSSVQNLRAQGIPVKVENYAGKLHSKSIIIDDEYILAGSMNFSRSGESRNDENMMIIKNPRLAVFYKDFFLYLWGKIPDIYLTRNPRAESMESIGSCFDGIDNDFDGKIDKADEGCFIRSK